MPTCLLFYCTCVLLSQQPVSQCNTSSFYWCFDNGDSCKKKTKNLKPDKGRKWWGWYLCPPSAPLASSLSSSFPQTAASLHQTHIHSSVNKSWVIYVFALCLLQSCQEENKASTDLLHHTRASPWLNLPTFKSFFFLSELYSSHIKSAAWKAIHIKTPVLTCHVACCTQSGHDPTWGNTWLQETTGNKTLLYGHASPDREMHALCLLVLGTTVNRVHTKSTKYMWNSSLSRESH